MSRASAATGTTIGEVVTPVESIFQPTVFAAACLPATTVSRAITAGSAQTSVLGLSAVAIEARTAPVFALRHSAEPTSKINYMYAAANGTATPILVPPMISAMRDHQVQVSAVGGVKVQGPGARGIPPRGRPV